MITTKDLKEPARVEPEKLNHITTGSQPYDAPRPEVKGDGFSKMITTHDEPKPEGSVPGVVEPIPASEAEVKKPAKAEKAK